MLSKNAKDVGLIVKEEITRKMQEIFDCKSNEVEE